MAADLPDPAAIPPVNTPVSAPVSAPITTAITAGSLTLVSGPARSGKSRWAEHLADASGLAVVYVATGPELADDREWQQRLALHRRRRPAAWQCLEVGGALAPALVPLQADQLALVDSLGTWVAAHLDLDAPAWEQQCLALETAIASSRAAVLLVAEECGWGVIPATAIGGRFRDRLGNLQQQLARRADRSWLVLQGRAIDLFKISLPVPAA